MSTANRLLPVLLALFTWPLPAPASESGWIDSMAVTLGKDDNGNATDIYQIGVQNRWNRTWFNNGAWYVGGYWDISLAYWDSDNDINRSLYDLSLTPILRLQRDAELSRTVSPFSEVGVGGHMLSDQEIGRRDLSSNFQFGSHFGVGFDFGDRGHYELMYRYQHLSNGGAQSPDQGINLHLVSFGYAFD